MRLKTTTIFALMLLPMIALAQQQQYQQVNDISYTESSDAYAQERCKLDVYYPTDQKDAPVVVWFHGGGIEGGEKHIDPQLKNSGLVVVAANYRLLPKAPIDDILDDAAAAVAWTYKNIAKYNGSPRKIFVAGHSAGGYLLDIIGLDKRWLAKYGVDADSLAALNTAAVEPDDDGRVRLIRRIIHIEFAAFLSIGIGRLRVRDVIHLLVLLCLGNGGA